MMVMVSVIRAHATSMWCKGNVCTTIGVVYMCVVPWCVSSSSCTLMCPNVLSPYVLSPYALSCVIVTPPYIEKEVGNF